MRLGYGFWLKRESKSFRSAVAAYEAMASEVVTSKQLKYRAKMVGQVLSDRFEYAATMKKMDGFFSDQVIIDNFELVDRDAFEVEGRTKTETGVDEVEQKVVDINAGLVEDFSGAELTSLGWEEGEWSFTMEVALK